MFPHLPLHDVRDIGTILDVTQSIMLVAVACVLWALVRMVRQLHAVARFWMKNWNGTPGIGGLHAIDVDKAAVRASQKSTVVASD